MKKKLLQLALVLLTALCLSSCRIGGAVGEAMAELRADADGSIDYCNKIVDAFDQRDAEALKALFSENACRNFDLDSEIANAFEMYEGKSVSFTCKNVAYSGGGTNDGKWCDKHFSPEVSELRTDADKTYYIYFSYYQIYDYDPRDIGIGHLSLWEDDVSNSDDTKLAEVGGYK